MASGIVLTYHGLSEERSQAPRGERKYWLAAARFRAHLKQIASGHRVLTLGDFWTGVAGADGAVVLTFDDGKRSDYERAWPLLMELGLRATFFLNTSTVGTNGFVSWSQARELHRSGMTFGSHGHEHVYLTWLGDSGLRRQLCDSKRIIEDRLGCPVEYFSAPYGDLNESVRLAAREAGYRAVCNSRNRPATSGFSVINRVAVYRTTSARTVALLAAGNPLYLAARQARDMAIFLPKGIRLRWRRWNILTA